MPAGYVIAQLKVTNPENYKEYVEKVTPLVKKFGGEFLVRAGEFQIFDGETNFPRIIILKFPFGINFVSYLSNFFFILIFNSSFCGHEMSGDIIVL